MDFLSNLNSEIVIIIAILILSIVIHEMAHGYTALFLGDDTAEKAGRLTLNPIPHLDPIGSVLLPAFFVLTSSPFFFGYAKPVPYNPDNIEDKKWGNSKVAIAGPIANLILALFFVIIAGILTVTGYGSESTFRILQIAAFLNIFLAVFNMLPIPPLDGSKVFLDFIRSYSVKWYLKISKLFNKYQIFLLIAVIIFVIATNILVDISALILNFYELLIFWI